MSLYQKIKRVEKEMDDGHGQLLPIANVVQIMKQILPPGAKISKEAKETIQECATEFISFVTGEASDKCRKDNRKTLNGDDICWALSELGLDDYTEAILRYLHKYREKTINGNKAKGEASNYKRMEPSQNNQTLEFSIIEKGNNSLIVKEKRS